MLVIKSRSGFDVSIGYALMTDKNEVNNGVT